MPTMWAILATIAVFAAIALPFIVQTMNIRGRYRNRYHPGIKRKTSDGK